MEGYAATVNEWSRIYFMCFYLTIMMLLSIVVASVLDGFMFRISYKEQMSQEDGEICRFLTTFASFKTFFPFFRDPISWKVGNAFSWRIRAAQNGGGGRAEGI